MPGALRFVLGDQLSWDLAALRDLDPERDVVVMAEVAAETDYVPHHPKKIAFIFSAMRHFAELLRRDGITVDYVTLDDPANRGDLSAELERAVRRHRPARIIVTEPGEWRVLELIRGWAAAAGAPVEIREDDRFFCSRAEFARWAQGRRQLRMEFFYREMRARTGYLMEDGAPAGGKWNYDAENRKPPPRHAEFPRPMRFAPDPITEEVLKLVGARFGNRFGALEPFWFAVEAGQARRALAHFVKAALPHFGDFQDAMKAGEDWLYHSALSHYLNVGLLAPREVCDAVAAAYAAGAVPLNSAEGFIRQIIGWREYVRGIYWLKMPGYARENRLGNTRHLPAFYWTGQTEMACLAHALDQTRREALSHHIQRLMVTGNFALLAGVVPEEICTWYLAVYADAFEWVELPNTLGMVMHADGGYLGSKPYAASGAYIDRMSDFCRGCRFEVKRKNGPEACPFNYLYWNFLIENRRHFAKNPRMTNMYATLERMSPARRDEIVADARRFLAALEPWRPDD